MESTKSSTSMPWLRKPAQASYIATERSREFPALQHAPNYTQNIELALLNSCQKNKLKSLDVSK